MHSCLYEGSVIHERRMPVLHRFKYRVFMIGLDLDELDKAFRGRWLWSARRPSLVWFRRNDHFGSPELPLDDAVRNIVEEELGKRPRGKILLVTNPRIFGFIINPISIYLCFPEDGENPEVAVFEVTNTPWGETHIYVIDLSSPSHPSPGDIRHFDKLLHVSPFMDMEYQYGLQVDFRPNSLRVELENHGKNNKPFLAQLALRRKEINSKNLVRVLMLYPFMTLKVFTAIYYQALRLAMKRIPFHPHPSRKVLDEEAPQS